MTAKQSKWLPLVAAVALVCGGAMLAGPRVYDAIAASASATATEGVIVVDSAKPTPAIARIINDPALDKLKKAEKLRVIPLTAVGPDLKKVQWALTAAKGKTLPVFATRSGAGKAAVRSLPPASTIAKTLGGGT